MKYQLEQDEMQAYLASSHYVDWQNPLIIQKAEALFAHCSNDLEKIRKAFLFVRDEIPQPKQFVILCPRQNVCAFIPPMRL